MAARRPPGIFEHASLLSEGSASRTPSVPERLRPISRFAEQFISAGGATMDALPREVSGLGSVSAVHGNVGM